MNFLITGLQKLDTQKEVNINADLNNDTSHVNKTIKKGIPEYKTYLSKQELKKFEDVKKNRICEEFSERIESKIKNIITRIEQSARKDYNSNLYEYVQRRKRSNEKPTTHLINNKHFKSPECKHVYASKPKINCPDFKAVKALNLDFDVVNSPAMPSLQNSLTATKRK